MKRPATTPIPGSRRITPLTRGEVLGLLGIALAVRVLYLLSVRDEVLFQAVVGDSALHVTRARAFLAGVVAESHAFTPPLYPVFLAILFALGVEGLETVRWVQAAGGAIAATIIGVTGGVLAGRVAGWTAGLLMALSPVVLFFDGELLSASPVLSLVSASVGAAVLGWRRGAPGWYACSGALLGAATLGQPNVLLLAVVPVWLAVDEHARDPERARPGRGARTLALLLGVSLLLVTGVLLQRLASGYWVPISAGGGVNLFIGNHPGARGGFELPPGSGLENTAEGLYESARAVALSAAPADAGETMGPAQVSSYWAGRAGRFFQTRPGEALRLGLVKLLRTVHRQEIPNHYDLAFFSGYTPLLGWNPVRFWWVGPLGLAGLIGWAWRRQRVASAFLAGAILYLMGVALFFVTSRYRLPVWPLLAVGAGLSIETLRGWRHRRRPAMTILAITAPLILVSVLPTALPYSPAHTLGLLATELRRRGDEAGERVALEEAARYGHLPEVAHNLGRLHRQAGRVDLAATYYARALEIDPEMDEARLGLALCALELGRPAVAVELFGQVLERRPGDRGVRHELGRALTLAGRPGEALAVLEPLLDTRGTSANHFEVGLAMARLGRVDEAAERFTRAVVLDPQNAAAHVNLGLIEEGRGRLEAARVAFLAARGGAADNLERLLGLGRIELAAGDPVTARVYLERAQEVAPEDPRAPAALAGLGPSPHEEKGSTR